MKKILFFLSICAIFLSAYSTMKVPMPKTVKSPSLNELAVISAKKTPTPTALPPVTNGEIHVQCTNSLTDATSINTAIENSAPGDEIVISGQCLINQTIKLLSDRSYRGRNREGTILKQADGANLVALLASDTFLENNPYTGGGVSIRHMILDGNRTMNEQGQTDGIILRSWFSVAEDIWIRNMSQDGIKLANKTANGTDLIGGQVNGKISDIQIDSSGRYGVYGETGITDWNLLDNWIADSGADGIHLESAAGWVIERNHIYGVPHNAIYAFGLFGTSLSDNYIEGFGETSQTGVWYGIYADIGGGAASTISNNRIFNLGVNAPINPASTYYYLATTVDYNTGVVSVTSNVLRGSGIGNEIGLYYSGGGHQLLITSANNVVEGIATPRFIDNDVTQSPGY